MNEADIPIDIHTGKLQDWLVSRRHVKKDWQKSIIAIREKINNAIQDMPVHDGIAKLLTGSHINYFHCLKIIDILKETEADSKNLFGRYGSQRMKDWQEIAKLYERDNIYLAETANLYVRNVNFEMPSIKKQITKFEQLQNECDKKAADYAKKDTTAKGEFNAVCKQMGINGDKIKVELIEKINELPNIYEKIGNKISMLKPAIDLYASFSKCIVGSQQSQCCLPLIKFMTEHGNTTVYQWNYGEPPISIEPDQITINFDFEDDKPQPATDDAETIDFGDFTNASNDDQIDFGDIDIKSGEIDWGDVGSDANVQDDLSQSIDLNISLEESGIVVEDAGMTGGIAKGKEALTLLDNPMTRDVFLDQILELEAFLKMRLYEISTDESFNTFCSMQDLPIESTDSIASMLDVVQLTLSEMTEKKLNHLHNIKHSPRYVDTLVAQLNQKIAISKKMNEQIEVVKTKKKEAQKNAKALLPVLNLIIDKTKELQLQIEGDISKKYNGRTVNLIGGAKSL